MTQSPQTWQAERYARNARFVSDLGAPLIDLLAPRPGERILDLGCGDGALTEKLVATGAAVVGVDAGTDMVAAARARGLDAHVADAQALAFTAEFDGVFSNAALHWMKRPDDVLAGVARALKPGGRFVAEMGGAGNVAAVIAGLVAALGARGIDAMALHPWYFPSDEAYAVKLRAHGFVVDEIRLFPRTTPLPGRLGDWLDTFGETFLRAVPEAERGALKEAVEAHAARYLRQPDGTWVADYVRLRFVAHRSP